MRTTKEQLQALLERVEKATGPDNALDVEIDVALFVPDANHDSVRANSAGTKLVYQRIGGGTDTYWARDHTLSPKSRANAATLLSALISQSEEMGE